MNDLVLKTADGLRIVLPASLSSITTYILLEQDDWFEKEIRFLRAWLKPGMTALDVGANLGIYSLMIAHRVAPGQVHAFEPGRETAARLNESRALNRLSNLNIHVLAVSDSIRKGWLGHGASSELNALNDAETGEEVQLVSIDALDEIGAWAAPDFVKLDAEGEELRVLSGGRRFFQRHSPLVMFEIKAQNRTNTELIAAFRTLGYEIYRLLSGAPVIVPVSTGENLDGFEINLFAAKPDRATALAKDGWLVERIENSSATASYEESMAAFNAWRDPSLPVAVRVNKLNMAVASLQALCAEAANYSRLSSLARAAWEAGKRSLAVGTLKAMQTQLAIRPALFPEPFWAPLPRFDGDPVERLNHEWMTVTVAESLDELDKFSSFFRPPSPQLIALSAAGKISRQMQKRCWINAARNGVVAPVPSSLLNDTPEHLNAEIWRSGKISELTERA